MLKNFDEVLEKVRSIEPFTVSVAAAADKELLQAVKTAADLGFVRPVLVGDPKTIGDICTEIGLKPLDILAANGEEEAVAEFGRPTDEHYKTLEFDDYEILVMSTWRAWTQ